MKELAKKIKGEFKCLAENTEKYITFSVPTKNDRDKKYKIKFIDSFRLMRTSSNLSDRLHSDKCT